MSGPRIRRRTGGSPELPPPRTRGRPRTALLVAVVALLVGVGATALASRSPEPLTQQQQRGSTTVPTSQATEPCPPVDTDHTTTHLFAVSPPPGGQGSGELTVSTLDPDNPVIRHRTDQVGRPVTSKVSSNDAPALVVGGTGSLAPGLTGMSSSVESGKTHSGLAASWCSSGADSWWFSGVSTAVGSTTRVVLTNPTPAISVADLHLYGPKGAINAVGARGIALAPESTQSLDLSRFAPGIDALTVNVQATSGRVTAAVHTDEVAGAAPLGSEWIAPSVPPAPTSLLNPGPTGADKQLLQITNPGLDQALVKVQLVSADGTFTPSGYTSISVKPGAVLTKNISKVVGKDVSGVLLNSSGPVTGAIISTTSSPADFTVTSAGSLLGDPAVVPLIDGADLTIVFTSAEPTQGQVTIKAVKATGDVEKTQTLSVRGARATTWDLPKAVRTAAYLVIATEVPAGTQAVALYEGKDGVTSLPVESGSYTVSRPHVQSSR